MEKRFTIRRLPITARTPLPWCLRDSTRPYYVGRFATWTEARDASVGFSIYKAILSRVVATESSYDLDLPFRVPR